LYKKFAQFQAGKLIKIRHRADTKGHKKPNPFAINRFMRGFRMIIFSRTAREPGNFRRAAIDGLVQMCRFWLIL
jgi:hypothetical protein